jgi:hypothetical protein
MQDNRRARRMYLQGGMGPSWPVVATPVSELQARSGALAALPRARRGAETVLPAAEGGLLALPGGLGATDNPLSVINAARQRPVRMYGGGDQPQTAPWLRRNPSIRDVLEGNAAAATVTDPRLFAGSVAGGTARPGNVRQQLTLQDLVANPRQAVAGVRPEAAMAVYQDLIDPPNERGWPLPPASGEGPQDVAGGMFVDPTDSRTNLPSDVPVYLRGEGAFAAAERSALQGSAAGGLGQDASLVSTAARTGRRPVGPVSGDDPARAVPVAVIRPDGTFGVRYADPTVEARNIEIPIDQRLSTHNSDVQDYQTLGFVADELRKSARTPLMPRSALEHARRQGRFQAIPVNQREGSLVGELRQSVREGNRMIPGGQVVPVYAPTNRDGDQLTVARDIAQRYGDPEIVPEKAYRPGVATNVDIEAVRSGLADVFGEVGMPVSRGLVPAGAPGSRDRSANTVRLNALEDMIREGLAVQAPGGQALDLQGVRELVRSIRQQPAAAAQPTLFVTNPPPAGTQGPIQLVSTLLPEVQQNPRVMTGAFVRGVEGETGPALLNSNPDVRVAAERFMEARGYGTGESTITGLLNSLASSGRQPPRSGLDAPVSASPVVQLLARETAGPLGAGQVTPGMAYRLMGDGAVTYPAAATSAELAPVLPPAGSYGARLLSQDVYDYLQGQVPMSQIVQSLQLRQQAPQPMGRAMPDPMQPQGPVSAYYPGGVAQAPLQQQAAGAVLGNPRQLGLAIDGRPVTSMIGANADPSWATRVAQGLERIYGGGPAQVRVPASARADTVQLPLDLAGATAVGGQMELPIPAAAPVAPSPAALAEAALQRAYAGAPEAGPPYVWPVSDWAAATDDGARLFGDSQIQRPWQLKAHPDQLGIPFQDIRPDVTYLPPERVGRAAGPYAGAPIYANALDRSRYQSSLSGNANFDYADMARRSGAGGRYGPITSVMATSRETPAGLETSTRNVYGPSPDNLGAEVGSPEQELALRQLAARIRARQSGLA